MRDIPWEDIFKLTASAAASEFCEWVQVGIDVYIPHRKYQVKPHSSPWFSAAYAAAIVHKNHFFRLYQQNKFSEPKVKFRQTSNHCKRVLEAVKLAYMLIKQKSLSLSRNLALRTYGKLLVFSTKINLLYLLYLTTQRCCLLHLIKQNCLLRTFKDSNLYESSISLPVFPSRTNLKLHNASLTPKMVKKVIMNLDSSKASAHDCTPVVVLKNCESEL